jgi:hypothetical protein
LKLLGILTGCNSPEGSNTREICNWSTQKFEKVELSAIFDRRLLDFNVILKHEGVHVYDRELRAFLKGVLASNFVYLSGPGINNTVISFQIFSSSELIGVAPLGLSDTGS